MVPHVNRKNPSGPQFCLFVWDNGGRSVSQKSLEYFSHCHKHSVSLSPGSRMETCRKREDVQPEVTGSSRAVSERDTDPTLCCNLSQREANHPNTGSILSCIINTLCHHCVWLSWTRSHTGSTFVFSSHTNLTSTHTALTQPLNIPKLVLRLYVLYLTFDPVHKCVCERDAEREGALPHASVRTYFKHFMGI